MPDLENGSNLIILPRLYVIYQKEIKSIKGKAKLGLYLEIIAFMNAFET